MGFSVPSAIPAATQGQATPIAPQQPQPSPQLSPIEDPSALDPMNAEPDPMALLGDHDGDFEENLANKIPAYELSLMSLDILEGIESDIESRQEWEDWYEKGLQLLGLKMEDASGEANSMGTISKVYDQTLLESVIKFQSNARGELLPAEGPVKVKINSSTEDFKTQELADALEQDVNHYLTVVDRDYYPNFDRMLFDLGFCGVAFRKLYHSPIENRPVDEWIPAIDLIVSNNATSLSKAGRYTHRIMMEQDILKRLQKAEFYRDVDLVAPNEDLDEAQRKILEIEGVNNNNKLPRDQRHTIYECYTNRDSSEWDEYGKEAGFPIPYRITLDKDSREILEVRRFWKKGDEDFKAKRRIVKYGYIPGLGFYDYGLVHLLGNNQRALTAIERQLVDAGQFKNFPGFLYTKQAGRQETNHIVVPPGAGQGIDTGGLPITSAVMPLPYGEPSGVLFELKQDIQQNSMRLGGTAEVPVGEGNMDIPVGTMVALVEQSTKIISAVHKRNHASQAEEYEILRELFMEDPEALWRFARKPARKWQMAEELADLDLVCAADPNTPSKIHRIMKAAALGQLATQYPAYFKTYNVLCNLLQILGYGDLGSILNSPQEMQQSQQQQSPEQQNIMLQSQARAQEQQREIYQDQIRGQNKMQEIQAQSENDAADRQSKETIERLKFAENVLRAKQESNKSVG